MRNLLLSIRCYFLWRVIDIALMKTRLGGGYLARLFSFCLPLHQSPPFKEQFWSLGRLSVNNDPSARQLHPSSRAAFTTSLVRR